MTLNNFTLNGDNGGIYDLDIDVYNEAQHSNTTINLTNFQVADGSTVSLRMDNIMDTNNPEIKVNIADSMTPYIWGRRFPIWKDLTTPHLGKV